MNITESRLNDHLVIAPVGRLDSNTSPVLDRYLTAAIGRGDTRLVLDFSGVEYISSTGLSALLAAAKKLRATNGRIALAGLNARVRTVFEMSGFLRLFPTFADTAAASAD